ncbi:MAG: glutathione S-transferase family protein [Gammaproteobacteria bacterium]|nr:glutathione S-transferase family protein [Gammaproteobacteria bacterium]MDH4312412.1 glutathione S-transferase family protein [Gammaproteobacteria bacterium]
MKLHTSLRAPNPRRVDMFLIEKGITGIEREVYDLNAGEHRSAKFTAMNPVARVPVLELDDGRFLAESRAICSYLESLYPEPNLMGVDADERAFIEMADRQVELTLLAAVANHVRHTHPGLLPLENPQFPDYAAEQGRRMVAAAALFDQLLSRRRWMAGDRFTIADITAFCGLEFARLVKFRPADAGLKHLADWRERVAERPSAKL